MLTVKEVDSVGNVQVKYNNGLPHWNSKMQIPLLQAFHKEPFLENNKGIFTQSVLEGRILFEGTAFYAIVSAKNIQFKSGYAADDYTMVTLKKGQTVYGGKPGQTEFYTDLNSVLESNMSRSDLFQGLQSAPHRKLGYRPRVESYTVIEDISVPTGRTSANPQYGI